MNALHQAANAGGKMYAQSATDVPSAEKEAVRKQYEGTEQWMKAPNGKPTNLTEDQWGAVRTPAFKAWFGDWEQAARLMLPRHAENLEEAAAAARSIAGKRLTNDLLGVDARVHALAVANVDRLFSRAITEYTHKDRNNDKNIKQIHRMFSPFVVGDNVFVAKLTVKELVQEKEGKRLYSVEALEIKEASRKWNAAYNATEGVLTSFPQEAFDNIIARFLPDDKNCSKIVDENASRWWCTTEVMQTLMSLTEPKGAQTWTFKGCSFPRGNLIQRGMERMSVRPSLTSVSLLMRGRATRL